MTRKDAWIYRLETELVILIHMNLIFLCKRRPMGRDLLKSPYGRFYFLPKILAEKGHQVHVVFLSYRREPSVNIHRDGINWISVSLFYEGPFKYVSVAKRLVREIRADWIIGFSDTYYGILAQRLGDRYGTKSLVDAYDNYEGYIPWLKPLHHVWRKSLSRTTLVTAAGPKLVEHLQQSRPGKPAVVVPMAADPVGFAPMDRRTCREGLDLPLDKKLVGYCGGISSSRGIEILFDGFGQLTKKHPNVTLILSGRKDKNIRLPAGAKWLGYLPSAEVPKLLNSLDVLVVSNRPSKFGNYSHPVKLYEAMACSIPVVASDTPATRWILEDHPELLVTPENPCRLREKVESAMVLDRVDYGPQPDWHTNCEIFEHALKTYS